MRQGHTTNGPFLLSCGSGADPREVARVGLGGFAAPPPPESFLFPPACQARCAVGRERQSAPCGQGPSPALWVLAGSRVGAGGRGTGRLPGCLDY